MKTDTATKKKSDRPPKNVKEDEDVDAYRTDDMKPPLEESQCNIAKGDAKEDEQG